MKRILFLTSIASIALIFSVSCGNGTNKEGEKPLSTDIVKNPNTANGTTDTSNLPVFKFDEEIHDFGRIWQGEKVSYGFKFKNVGKSDLVISDAHGSCGCTIADYPKAPIAPKASSVIDVTFNSEGKKGYKSNTITLIANTQPNTKVLVIKAQVKVPAGASDE